MTSGNIKHRVDDEKNKGKEEIQPSTFADAKFDQMMRNMEKLVDNMSLENKPTSIEPIEPHIRNPNFRRPLHQKSDRRTQWIQEI